MSGAPGRWRTGIGLTATLARLTLGDARERRLAAALRTLVLPVPRRDETPWVRSIEARRRELESSTRRVGTHLPGQDPRHMTLGEVTRRVTKRRRWGLTLLRLVRLLAARRCVEVGSSVGLSGAYLAAGLAMTGGGRLVTLEGARDIAGTARETFGALGLAELVTVHQGRFPQTLPAVLDEVGPVDLVFVDGDHDPDATLEYFAAVRGALRPGGIAVFDDIRWSAPMTRAWEEIEATTPRGVVADLGSVGLWSAPWP